MDEEVVKAIMEARFRIRIIEARYFWGTPIGEYLTQTPLILQRIKTVQVASLSRIFYLLVLFFNFYQRDRGEKMCKILHKRYAES